MGPQARMAAGHTARPEAGVEADDTAAAGPFVINLCSSTTPMALSHPDTPELKRFSFFVSRRREDNRERFRLHMGYFNTLAEAEEWLAVVREIYPGAWAGEAPGKKLRARAAAAELAKQLPPPPPMSVPPRVVSVTASPAPVSRTTTPAAQQAQGASNLNIPTLRPASVAGNRNAAQVAARAAQANGSAVVAGPAASPASAPAPQSAARVAASQRPAAPSIAPAAASGRAAKPASVASAAKSAQKPLPPALAGSNVREVLAALDESEDTGATRLMRVPPGRAPAGNAQPSAIRASSAQQGAAMAPRVSAPAAAPRPVAAHAAPAPAKVPPALQVPPVEATSSAASLSDTQVLRFLEERREPGTERGDDEVNSGISLLKPDDTQTRLALKEAVRDNAPVAFAVQLCWSVQPIELDKVPPLAIFSAYTLYTVEGSREGRKWYGLRLGFFSDAISAKQVAYYVRSEFASVAVVPVSPQEKARATAEESRTASNAFATRKTPEPKPEQKVEEFKLFDDDKAAAPEPTPAPKVPVKPAAAKAVPSKKKPLGRVRARERRSPKTLEETLEILGASELEIDNGRGELLNDTGVRHLRVEVQKNTPFARLLDRLSERVRRS